MRSTASISSQDLTVCFRFGDHSPGKAFEGFQDDPVAFMKMCFTVVYCIFGKALMDHFVKKAD